MSPRLLALAIDAANADLVERWATDGTLPVLRGLFAEGLSGRCRSVEAFYVGSTWPSLYTAVSPARHGYQGLTQLRPGTYEARRPQDGALVHAEAFWDHLARSGLRSAILDVPLAPLSSRLAGMQLVEWGSHSTLHGFGANPASLAEEIAARFGARPSAPPCEADLRTPEAWAVYVERLERDAARKGELTRFVLAREPVDFALQVFTEAHCAGHHAWHLHDPAHPSHDPRLAANLGDPLRRVYAAIDAAIGAVIADCPAATVVAFAAHGMSHLHAAQFLLRDLLVRLGVTAPLAVPRPSPRERAVALAGELWLALPAPLRRALGPVKRHAWREATAPAPRGLGVDAAASRCFPVSNGLAVGGIRLNLAGREPAGRLAPGNEADAFCAELAAQLLALRAEPSGRALVRSVRRTRDLFQGERLDALPDLLVEWNDEAPIGNTELANGRAATLRVTSPALGSLEASNGYDRTGEHRAEGFFVACGPGIRPGRFERVVSTLDLAPSFCARLGAPMTGVEGQVLSELVAAAAGASAVGSRPGA